MHFRLQKYYISLWNHAIKNALKFVHQWRLVFCIYVLIIILFHLQMMYILCSLTALSAVLQEVVSVTVSTIQYSNAYHNIQYYYTIALILIIIIFIISICSQTHKCYYNAKHFHLFSFHVNLRVYKCACVIKFHLGKWHPIRDQISAVLETLFFHSIWRYQLGNCTPEFYYKCDWNCPRIIVPSLHRQYYRTLW